MLPQKQDPTDMPRLAPPGAGIPWLERQLLSGGLRLLARRWSVAEALRRGLQGLDDFVAAVEPLAEPLGRRRVLVPRLRGLEDSSRCYSPYMVLQHVAVFDRMALGLVALLAAGRTSSRRGSTADLKPSPEAGPETLEAIRQLSGTWRERLEGVTHLSAAARHPHPWFGELSAHQWLCVAVLHHDIHLRQLRLILTEVPSDP